VQATWAGIVLLDGALQYLLATSRDVDFGSIRDEGLRDHEANAGAATGDDGRYVGDIEEVGELELVVATGRLSIVSMPISLMNH